MVYERPSYNKMSIENELKEEMQQQGGRNYKVCSYNTCTFTAAFEDDKYIYYFTKCNNYKILK